MCRASTSLGAHPRLRLPCCPPHEPCIRQSSLGEPHSEAANVPCCQQSRAAEGHLYQACHESSSARISHCSPTSTAPIPVPTERL